jgi:hypothetical protein
LEVVAVDYGELIRRSWWMVWRHRFLWVLGLFAASTVGSCSPTSGGGPAQYQVGPGDFRGTGLERLPSEMEGAFRQIPFEQLANRETIVAIVAMVALLGLAILIVSVIAQGAMAEATASLAMGRDSSLGPAWRTGLRLFWRYVGLWLVLVGVGVLIALAFAAAVGALVAMASLSGEAVRTIFIVVGALLGLAAMLVLVPLFIVVTVAMTYAQRAIAVENVGPLSGLEAGFRLVRSHIGTSALAWLIGLALSIGAGIAIAVAAVVLLIPLGGVAAVLFATTGVSAAAVIYTIAGVVALGLAIWLLAGVANSFFWSYWTFIYLRLTGRLTERLDVTEL